MLGNLLINVSLNSTIKKSTVANKSSLYMQILQVPYLLSTNGLQVNVFFLQN
jgi:hypothetical protein